MQLMHSFVQKWTITTFPFWSASLSGSEFTHAVTPVNSGAGAGVGSPSAAAGRPGFGPRSNPRPTAKQTPRVIPNSRRTAAARLVFIVHLHTCDRAWGQSPAYQS